jgi:L-galactose dehydrogenase
LAGVARGEPEIPAARHARPLVSELGFGASLLGDIYGRFAEKAGIEAEHAALDAGITFFDVNPYYGVTASAPVLR